MFSKMLQEFPIAEAAGIIRKLGFGGVDLTVRPQGHVEPDGVGRSLPEAVKAIRDQGLTVPMITTALTTADRMAEEIVAAAVHEEIRLLKLGYWNVPRGGLVDAIERARKELDGLARLAERYHVTFGIHNHSGPGFVSCQPAVVWSLLRDRDPKQVAAYFDPGHAAVEGGFGGWRQALELLGPSIRIVAVKDFGWKTVPGEPKVRWESQQLPLRDGLVPWAEVFAGLNALKYDGPVSLHSEYKGSHSWRDLTTPQLIEQTAADLAFVRSIAGNGGVTSAARRPS
jgi:sugar phosphate isomerase/epimerase